jgi:uncharacterized protein (TIGR02266 family)
MENMDIMLVANDGIFIEQIKCYLRNTGISLTVCREYDQAVKALRKERCGVVYIASRMDRGCIDCLRAIKGDPDMRHLPVVMAAAKADERFRQMCRDAGCAYILMKPIDRPAFLSSVRSFIDPEKRDNARFEAQLDVSYGFDAPDSVSVCSVNISRGGVFVRTNQALPVDSMLKIRIILPNAPTPIETKARVAWINRLGAPVKPALPPGMALEFLEMKPEDTNLVSLYIHDEHIVKLLT